MKWLTYSFLLLTIVVIICWFSLSVFVFIFYVIFSPVLFSEDVDRFVMEKIFKFPHIPKTYGG
jgi:hypothetical protein